MAFQSASYGYSLDPPPIQASPNYGPAPSAPNPYTWSGVPTQSTVIGTRQIPTAAYRSTAGTSRYNSTIARSGRSAPLAPTINRPSQASGRDTMMAGLGYTKSGGGYSRTTRTGPSSSERAGQNLLSQYSSLYKQGRASDRESYAEILRGYQDRYKRNLEYVEQTGGDIRSDIERRSEREQAVQTQGLISRGLGNTTIRASVSRGVEEDRARRISNLEQQLMRLRQNVDAPLSQDTLQFQERSRETYPSLGQIGQLQMQLSANRGY